MDISMVEAIEAGDGTLHGAIDYWQLEAARLRAEVEALREDAAKCRAELLAIHEIASCGWSNVLQHPIAPADTLTVRDVKIMAIELLKGHQTAEPRVHG